MSESIKFIKDYYFDFYMSKDTIERKVLTRHVNALLACVPPKDIAQALVALYMGNKDMFDAEELSK